MRTRRELLHSSAALALTYALPAGLIGSARAQAQDEIARPLDVPYVPTPVQVVDAMLDLAKVVKSDIVYDLGCGDGRIVARRIAFRLPRRRCRSESGASQRSESQCRPRRRDRVDAL